MIPRKSIAFFMHDLAGGGVERMRLALAREFITRGYSVHLVVVSATGPLLKDVPAGVNIVDLASDRVSGVTLKFRRWVCQVRPAIVVSSLDHNNIVALLAFTLCRSTSRLIICQHNTLSSELRLGWRYRLVPMLYWLLKGMADGVVAVSNGVAEDLTNIAGIARNRITVIPNPVINYEAVPITGADVPHPWFKDTEVPVFVFAGRLVAQKDPLMLIDAFTRRLAFGPARLVILGDGVLRSDTLIAVENAGIRTSVLFTGFVKQPLQWIIHAEALLLTSRYEGFGNVIVEALACGTPVVSMDCPHGPSEILAGGRFGILVRPGDTDGFARAMMEGLRKRFPSDELRARGREFTVSHAADLHEKLFADVDSRLPPQVFGLTFSRDSATAIGARIANAAPSSINLIVTVNIDHIRHLKRAAFYRACANAYLVCADGWPIAAYAGIRCAAPWRRVTGCDILHAFMANEMLVKQKVFAILESATTARALETWLAAQGIDQNWSIEVAVQGFANDPTEQFRVARAIKASMAAVIIMTIGAPVSEVFIDLHRDVLPPCWVLCVGQALRVELGLVSRAPKAWRLLGLEWAWRCTKEPKRLPLRYLRDLLWFPLAIINDVLLAKES